MNEFVVKNGLISKGSVYSTGPVTSSTFLGNLQGTASYATNAHTVDSVTSSSYATKASTSDSASYATNTLSASYAGNVPVTSSYANSSLSSSWAQNAHSVDNAATATSASYATNAHTVDSVPSASYANSSSWAGQSTTAVSSSYATKASTADSSSYATVSQTANSASYATKSSTADSASFSTNTISSSYSLRASTSDSSSYSSNTLSSSYALNASNASSASYAPEQAVFVGNKVISGSLSVTSSVELFGYMDFEALASNAPTPAAGESRLHAFTKNGFTRVEQDNEAPTNTILSRDNVFVGKNVFANTITAGSPVYVSGSSGNAPTVLLARANSLSTLPAVGIALDSIAANAFGQIMKLGQIDNINTSGWSAGDQLYVDPTTSGSLTNVRPSYPNYEQPIAVVLVSGIGNGSLLVATAPFVGGKVSGTTTGFQVSQSLGVSGSANFLGGITASLQGTASYATNAHTVDNAATSTTASFSLHTNIADFATQSYLIANITKDQGGYVGFSTDQNAILYGRKTQLDGGVPFQVGANASVYVQTGIPNNTIGCDVFQSKVSTVGFIGTASWANNSISASWAPLAAAVSTSYASVAQSANTATSASYATKASTADSSSYSTNAFSSSFATKAINSDSSSYSTAAQSANTATSATTATSASYATKASTSDSSSYSTNTLSSSYAIRAGNSDSSSFSTSASYATNAHTVDIATSSSYAVTASYASKAHAIDSDATASFAISASYLNWVNVSSSIYSTFSQSYSQSVSSSYSGDPSTYLLLHFSGSNGSQVFTDSGSHPASNWYSTITTDGTITASNSKFGGTSWYNSGGSSNHAGITCPNNYFQVSASTDFTLEAWFNLQDDTYQSIFNTSNTGSFAAAPGGFQLLKPTGPPSLYLQIGSGLTSQTTANNLPGDGKWHHIAVVRSGSNTGNVKVYADGVATSASLSYNGWLSSSFPFQLGVLSGFSSENVAGYIDEFRFSNGVARYTASGFITSSTEFEQGYPATASFTSSFTSSVANSVSESIYLMTASWAQNVNSYINYVYGGNYTSSVSDTYILCVPTSSVNIYLSTISSGKMVTVKNASSATQSITIRTQTGSIDNQSNYVFSSSYGAARAMIDGINWWLV